MKKFTVQPTDGHGEFAFGVFSETDEIFVALVNDNALATTYTAAPAMLVALESCVEKLKALSEDYDIMPEWVAAVAAIRQAKGETT